jgi:hypothetical protein
VTPVFLKLRPRLTYSNVVSTLCLFILLGGGALAASTFIGSDGQIHGCVNKKTGVLRALKSGAHCKKHKEIALAWNQRGTPGAPATKLWAVVNSAGTLLRGSGAVSAAKTAGGYEVDFNRDVSNCSYDATLGATSAEVGQAGVGPRSTNPNGVYVYTTDSAGAAADRGFNLAVFC